MDLELSIRLDDLTDSEFVIQAKLLNQYKQEIILKIKRKYTDTYTEMKQILSEEDIDVTKLQASTAKCLEMHNGHCNIITKYCTKEDEDYLSNNTLVNGRRPQIRLLTKIIHKLERFRVDLNEKKKTYLDPGVGWYVLFGYAWFKRKAWKTYSNRIELFIMENVNNLIADINNYKLDLLASVKHITTFNTRMAAVNANTTEGEIKLIKNSFFDFSGYLDSILNRDSLN